MPQETTQIFSFFLEPLQTKPPELKRRVLFFSPLTDEEKENQKVWLHHSFVCRRRWRISVN